MAENHTLFTYLADLQPIRTAVLNRLAGTPDALRVADCRGFKSGCHSLFCPACSRWDAHKRASALASAQSAIPQERLRFGTFRLRDVPLSDTRAAGTQAIKAARAIRNKLMLDGSAFSLEASTPAWDYASRHVHAHAILDTPATGRNRSSAASLEDAWLSVLPTDLRPVYGAAVEVKRLQSVQGASRYICKSGFHHEADDQEIDNLLATIAELKGVAPLHHIRHSRGITPA